MLAIADQGLVAEGQGTLQNTPAAVYGISRGDFYDVASGGNNNYSATTGYDFVTGLGSPLVPSVIGSPAPGHSPATGATAGLVGSIASALARSAPVAPSMPVAIVLATMLTGPAMSGMPADEGTGATAVDIPQPDSNTAAGSQATDLTPDSPSSRQEALDLWFSALGTTSA